MANKDWIDWLKENEACTEGFEEAKKLEPQEWYDRTERGEWLIWVLRNLQTKDKGFWVEVVHFCAEKVKGHVPANAANYTAKAVKYTANYASKEAANAAAYAANAAANAAYAADNALATLVVYASKEARALFRKELADFIRSISPILEFKKG